jgi:hypothetical protein
VYVSVQTSEPADITIYTDSTLPTFVVPRIYVTRQTTRDHDRVTRGLRSMKQLSDGWCECAQSHPLPRALTRARLAPASASAAATARSENASNERHAAACFAVDNSAAPTSVLGEPLRYMRFFSTFFRQTRGIYDSIALAKPPRHLIVYFHHVLRP